MKTNSKLSLLLITGLAAVITVSCKSKPGSASDSAGVPATNSTQAVSAKSNSVMDSLGITDPDEKKICALYDDAITDYITNYKTLMTDTGKDAQAQRKALDEKWKQKEAEIKPQVDAMRDKVRANSQEAIKFVQFSAYESKRLMGVMMSMEQNMLKNMPSPAPAR